MLAIHVQRYELRVRLEARGGAKRPILFDVKVTLRLQSRIQAEICTHGDAVSEAPCLEIDATTSGLAMSSRLPVFSSGFVPVLFLALWHPGANFPVLNGHRAREANPEHCTMGRRRELYADAVRPHTQIHRPRSKSICDTIRSETKPLVVSVAQVGPQHEEGVVSDPRRRLVRAADAPEGVGVGVEPPHGLLVGRLRCPMVETPR
mmetsp:Transcript_69679/g.196511  ORF Transcript_69679/g.196511 Transcript_69679/m.196511 type:complete len:205 (+) Transcript_69679:250-864(+)